MDWAKAKSILIVAFLITNLFLGYNVLKDSEIRNYAYTVSDKRINDVRELFGQKNITIKANILEKMKKLPQLTVEYETYDMELIKSKFPEFTSISEEAIRYQNGNEIVEVTAHNKSISYTNKNKTSISVEMDEKKAEEVAEDFISKHGFQGNDVELWSTKKKHGDYEIIYKQRYEDLILDHGYMKLTVKNGEVVKFEKRWLKPVDVKKFDKEIIPVTKALILATDDLREKKEKEDSELIIEDIRLAFKLDIFEFNELLNEKWYEINESTGTGSLYWRIRLADQDYIDIKAETYE
ncbi:two-component system regulatory protein YycI [Wukongibacter baidiensis]|uniref:two-component system regulatory protein YycI n=1 Tax=Wukongibacter baidiensis TaxID=1723361 RepID=UPI003D7F1B45